MQSLSTPNLGLVVALMLDNGPCGAKAHVHGGKAVVKRHVRLPLARLAIFVHGGNEIIPFDGSRTVVVAAVCRHVVIVNAVDVLDVRAIKDCLSDGFGRWRLTAIVPYHRVGSLKEVDCILWKICLQTTLRNDSK